MLLPRQPIEVTRPDRFQPPHCPRTDCPKHTESSGFRWKRAGGYYRKCDPRRRVPRYRCETCKKTFGRNAFSCTYYLKRPELLRPVAAGLVAGSAHRQLARSLRCAPSTVTRLSARIGRHSMLLQALALEELPELAEPVVLDHFGAFVFSQDDRLAIATAVGQDSWFVYVIDPAPHRRAGKRSARKKAPVRPLPPQVSGTFVRSTRRVIRLLSELAGDGDVELVTDDHPAYRAAAAAEGVAHHRIFPNPPRGPEADRARARERDRQMFPVDALHKLIRHSQAHHRRETIAFGRRSNALLERAALLVVWRNFVKGVSERKNDPTTPAMRLGLCRQPYRWRRIFSKRLFPARIRLPEGWECVYRRRLTTPAVGRNQRHDLQHAL